ncbi:MAG TPA: DUF5118 domain-containing protein, partial [Puia sp.]|nr:DUF5118 domain-containing protein [Puia sp.]
MKVYSNLFRALIVPALTSISLPAITLTTGLIGFALAAAAQRPGNVEGGARSGENAPGGREGGARPAETRPAATIASVTQNCKKFEGFYNFYYEEKTGKIYLEVDRFGQEFLYFSSLPQGVGNGGPERGQASA